MGVETPPPLSPTELPTYRRKYFHQLCPQPLDLPEIFDPIVACLTLRDIRKCTLVSMIWAKHFGPLFWETIYYNRFTLQVDPALQRNGHFIRKLVTYALRDKDIDIIAKYCPNLTTLDLELEGLKSSTRLSELFSRANRIQKIKIQMLNANEMGRAQRTLLEPIAQGLLSRLTEMRLIGFQNRRQAPIYQTGMILKCLEGCPLLQTLELSSVRLVDTTEQWDDAEKNSFSSSPNNGIMLNNGVTLSSRRRSTPIFSWWRTYSYSFQSTPPPTLTNTSIPETKDSIQQVSSPREDHKSRFLTTLKLEYLYGNLIVPNFVGNLLKRSPSLTHLALVEVPANIESLASLCPKLRILKIDSGPVYMSTSSPLIKEYLTDLIAAMENNYLDLDAGIDFSNTTIGDFTRIPASVESDTSVYSGLNTLRLYNCGLLNTDFYDFPQGFKRHQLRHLELGSCYRLNSLGVARFIAQCWSLETVSVDNLMMPVGGVHLLAPRTRGNNSNNNDSSSGVSVQTDSRAIKWECGKIRYLDVIGAKGIEQSFEHIFLDMVVRLDSLEFLGMRTDHVPWLMKHEPVKYIKRTELPIDLEDGCQRSIETVDNTNGPWNRDDNEPEDQGEPIPLGMFGCIKTLSLKVGDREPVRPKPVPLVLSVEHVKYLHDAFPALEKIVYNGRTFPCTSEACDWLLKTPRQIEVVFQSKEVEETVWNI
ncbi:hypothetical protein BGZ46_008970 [Entomortierella lignicola]|nr:hypothetical protein BGZ46_008970 [Entomortierella lignicola]